MEADFQREYGMDLKREAGGMSWRRFMVLLSNLSPSGAVALKLQREGKRQEDTDEDGARRAAADFFKAQA